MVTKVAPLVSYRKLYIRIFFYKRRQMFPLCQESINFILPFMGDCESRHFFNLINLLLQAKCDRAGQRIRVGVV